MVKLSKNWSQQQIIAKLLETKKVPWTVSKHLCVDFKKSRRIRMFETPPAFEVTVFKYGTAG